MWWPRLPLPWALTSRVTGCLSDVVAVMSMMSTLMLVAGYLGWCEKIGFGRGGAWPGREDGC